MALIDDSVSRARALLNDHGTDTVVSLSFPFSHHCCMCVLEPQHQQQRADRIG